MGSDRWSAETEELVAATKIYHRTTITDVGCSGPERHVWRCSCGSGRDRSAPTTWGVARDEAHAHEDRAILTALADAGLLQPPGGVTREEWGRPRLGGKVRPCAPAERDRCATQPEEHARRRVTVWPDPERPNDDWPRYLGPWVPVNDGGGT
jgi:hypothetical protein